MPSAEPSTERATQTTVRKRRVLKTDSKDIVIECKRYFGFRDVDELIAQRKRAFLAAFNANMQMITVYVTFVNTSLIAFSTNRPTVI